MGIFCRFQASYVEIQPHIPSHIPSFGRPKVLWWLLISPGFSDDWMTWPHDLDWWNLEIWWTFWTSIEKNQCLENIGKYPFFCNATLGWFVCEVDPENFCWAFCWLDLCLWGFNFGVPCAGKSWDYGWTISEICIENAAKMDSMA